MVEFIFTSVLMVSLSFVLYLMVRALPRIAEETPAEGKGLLDRWGRSQLPEQVDRVVNGFLVKFLRKTKIYLLKIDNSLSKHLQKVNPANHDAKKPNIDFKEIAGQNKESKTE